MHLENLAREPESLRFAVAVRHTVYREATGLNTFPTGGRERVLERRAILYLVDMGDDRIMRLAEMTPPQGLRTGFRAHVDGWRDGAVFFTLTGCPGPECYGDLNQARHYRVAPGRAPEPMPQRPSRLDHPPGMLARAPGEEVYLRLSIGDVETGSGVATLRVRTEEDAPFVPRYKLERSGRLVRMGTH